MTPERWGQLEELYQAARALPPSERAGLLEQADPELRATVTSLLAQEGLAQEGVPEKGDAKGDARGKTARSSSVQHGRVARAF